MHSYTATRLAALVALVALVLCLGAVGCGTSGFVDVPLTAFPTPTALSCAVGDTVSLGLTVAGGSGTPAVTFSPHDANVSVVVAGTSATVRCLAAGNSAVDFQVTSGGQTVAGAVAVSITAPPPLAVTLTPAALACVAGESAPLAVSVAGVASVAGEPTVTYAASNAGASVTGNGMQAVVRCDAPGTSTVEVTATAGRRTGSATLPITVAPPPLVVTFVPSVVECVVGQRVPVHVIATGGFGATTVTLAASGTGATVAGTADSAIVTCEAVGTSVITATATSTGATQHATLPVTISAPLAATPSVASITCQSGQTTTLAVMPSGGAGPFTVRFTAQNALVTVTASGNVATIACGAVSGLSAVNYTMTRGGETASGSVPVVVAGPLHATASYPRAGCWSGETVAITIDVAGGEGPVSVAFTTHGDVSYGPSDVTTRGSSTTVVLRCGLGVNTAVDWVVRRGAESVSGSVPLTIMNPIDWIQLPDPGPIYVVAGSSTPFAAYVNLASNAPRTTSTAVLYTSSNPSLVSVVRASDGTAELVTHGAATGTATIRAQSVAVPQMFVEVVATVGADPRVRLLSISEFVPPSTLQPANPSHVSHLLYGLFDISLGAFMGDSIAASLGPVRRSASFVPDLMTG
ncbi:MAG: hypothetical protein JO180_08840, partial [Gemmatirosa sp.]|nr:hypothetical protein [Gemmatirosa sp.]